MARALPHPSQNPVLKPGKLSFTDGRFTWTIVTAGGHSTYSVSDGNRTVSLPIEWAFGAESQTFLLSWQGSYLESMVSYYAQAGGLAITLGDDTLHPQTPEEALGRPLTRSVVTACFGCHSTNSVKDQQLDLQSLVAGVQCERCHQNASAHLQAVSNVRSSKLQQAAVPERLGSRSAEGISAFCGQCHRTWETVVRNNWRGESNVRFQPYRLANSKCFDGADARISCVACHNPHEDLVRDEAAYDGKCLACHPIADSSAKAAARMNGKPCPVANARCVTCHMPKVKLPGGFQIFTDHNIRVVKTGEPYPN